MACNCIKDIEGRMKMAYGETALVNKCIANDGTVRLLVDVLYHKRKCNGGYEKEWTEVAITPTYCPFCGKPYKPEKIKSYIMGIKITTGNEITIVRPRNGKIFELEELQAVVGGYIEGVRLKDGRTMYVNEEGVIRNLPINGAATFAAQQLIVGDVIIIERNEIE